jgi:hypothetical protein
MYATLGTVLVGLLGMVALTALVNILNDRTPWDISP